MNLFAFSNCVAQTILTVSFTSENADQQQKKEFLDELELMKTMAPHPNIVGLVGCCTKSGNQRYRKKLYPL